MFVEDGNFFNSFEGFAFIILGKLFLKLLHSNYVSVIIVIKIFLIFVLGIGNLPPPF